mmetsp:Transcript_2039/g.1838  ORF Transcript_2039/g.1838 Transcript_2039/m.1838 type:complete len:125 (+) Transcript_2039:376-750(+)
MNFHVFDRLLSMEIVSMPVTTQTVPKPNEKSENMEQEKNELKLKSKKNGDSAQTFVNQLLYQCKTNVLNDMLKTESNKTETEDYEPNLIDDKIEEAIGTAFRSLRNFDENHTEDSMISALLNRA